MSNILEKGYALSEYICTSRGQNGGTCKDTPVVRVTTNNLLGLSDPQIYPACMFHKGDFLNMLKNKQYDEDDRFFIYE